MSFGREKRLLLGALAALAALPLPFNEVVGWAAMLVFWLAVGLFLWRTATGIGRPLPTWGMNLLGLAYLPILFVDFFVLWHGRLLQPLVRLALFTLVVKLFGMKLEKEKWHILLLIFFTFVAAMGSSVHPSVVLYLVSFLAASILALARFAAFHVLSSYGAARDPGRPIPMRGFVGTATLLTILGAIPLFTFLPRLGSPVVMGPGGSSGTMVGGAGLTDYVNLDVIGRVRTSQAVVLRVAYETPAPPGHEMRFRAAVYSEFRGAGWARVGRRTTTLRRERDGFFHLSSGRSRSWVEIWLEPGVSSGLVLPVEAVAVDLAATALHIDQLGVVSVPLGRGRTENYRVGLPPETSRLRLAPAASSERVLEQASSQTGVSERIARLAREVAASGTPAEQARRIEEHLMGRYRYTLDLVGSQRENPVEGFLFDSRRGHCEYFASSMVLMLRSLGIPARFVTGYLGGEFSPFENYFVVRQSNAHAWVEAYLPESGWTTFDPTPPSGRPRSDRSGISQLMSQAYDYLIFRWDRYVLSYGFFDQVGLARRVAAWWGELWDRGRAQRGDDRQEDQQVPRVDRLHPEGAARDRFEIGFEGLAVVLVLLFGAAYWVWRHRPSFSATRAYRRLRAGVENDQPQGRHGSLAPLRLAARIEATHPPAAVPARRVIDLYLRESFGGQEMTDEELVELRAALREALQSLRKTA